MKQRRMRRADVLLTGLLIGAILLCILEIADRCGRTAYRSTKVETAGNSVQVPELPPRVALTFDDGPHPVNTEKLLDGLRERGVHATFFLIGQSCETYPDVVKAICRDGHVIGNHTYSHLRLTEWNAEVYVEELQKTNEIITSITGDDPCYMRPPCGFMNKKVEKAMDMIPVLWNVDPLDWGTKNADNIVNRVLRDVRDGQIILLHDVYASSVEAALRIVDALTERGYEFVTVDEILHMD